MKKTYTLKKETKKKMSKAKKGNRYAMKNKNKLTKCCYPFTITCKINQRKKWRKEAEKNGLSGSKWAMAILDKNSN